MASLLLDTPLTRDQKDFVQAIFDSGHGLVSIINDILDFSKIEAGRLRLEYTRFEIRTVLGNAFNAPERTRAAEEPAPGPDL